MATMLKNLGGTVPNMVGLLRAQAAAIGSPHPKYFVGAAIYYKRRLIATGANGTKTHPKVKGLTYSETLHAEMQAILNAKKIPVGSVMYIFRYRKCGSPGKARPCPVCLSFIRNAGIKKIVYTDGDGYREDKL